MFEDDFFINDNDLVSDNQPTLIDQAKMDLLNTIIEKANSMKESLILKETSEADNLLVVLSRYFDALIKLSELDITDSNEELSEEIEKIINDIVVSTTKITLSNIDTVLPKVDENNEDESNNDTPLSGGFHW